jgi:hypothetical protein
VTFGLVLQLVLALRRPAGEGPFQSAPDRLVNYLSFFTVQSNVLVAVTTGMLAARLDRRSTWFRVLRLDAVLCIAVTGVVFHLALADLQELTGWDALADGLLHTASPVLATLGWLLAGPRHQLDGRAVRLAVLAPVAWLAYALVRGAVVRDRAGRHYYPYPFMNAEVHGYPAALGACAVVAVLFVALAAGSLRLDRRLPTA